MQVYDRNRDRNLEIYTAAGYIGPLIEVAGTIEERSRAYS